MGRTASGPVLARLWLDARAAESRRTGMPNRGPQAWAEHGSAGIADRAQLIDAWARILGVALRRVVSGSAQEAVLPWPGWIRAPLLPGPMPAKRGIASKALGEERFTFNGHRKQS